MITTKARRAFATQSDQYYATKGHAVDAFQTALESCQLSFDLDQLMDLPGDEGRKSVTITDGSAAVGDALLAWYRMPSGRYEFVGYLC